MRRVWLVLVAAVVGCAAPTEPECSSTTTPMVNAQGDTVSTVTVVFCRP